MQGKEYRYAYAVSAKLPASFGNALAKFDVKEGTVKQWHEAGCIPVEPLMVPRPGAQVLPSFIGNRAVTIVLDPFARLYNKSFQVAGSSGDYDLPDRKVTRKFIKRNMRLFDMVWYQSSVWPGIPLAGRIGWLNSQVSSV